MSRLLGHKRVWTVSDQRHGRFIGRGIGGGGGPALVVYSLDNNHYEASQTLQSVTITGQGAPYDGTHDLTGILTGASDDIGWFVDPYRTGTEGVGNTLTINKGLWVSEGTTGLSETNVVRYADDQSTIATNVTLPYNYVQQVGDDTRGVEIVFTASNPTNSAIASTDVVVNANAPAVVSAAGPTPTLLNSNEFGDGKDYNLYEWNTAGTYTNDITFSSGGKIRILVIAGGGGGSISEYESGGGGGAGELVHDAAFSVASGSFTVTVGDGGAGGTNTAAGADGEDSVFSTLTALGGGRGATYTRSAPAGDGGSGGGAAKVEVTAGQAIGSGLGNDGGAFVGGTSNNNNSGGGGGAGAAGLDAPASESTNATGGDGSQNNITGTNTYYAGGGAGSSKFVNTNTGGLGGGGDAYGRSGGHANAGSGQDGTDGLGGGGGGGARYADDSSRVGGSGGGGTVKILVEV